MAILRSLILLLGVLAVLGLGATSTVAVAGEPAPCHDQADRAGHGAPSSNPDHPVKMTACCLGMIAPLAAEAPELSAPPSGVPALFAAPPACAGGLHPAPEPGPPRLLRG